MWGVSYLSPLIQVSVLHHSEEATVDPQTLPWGKVADTGVAELPHANHQLAGPHTRPRDN